MIPAMLLASFSRSSGLSTPFCLFPATLFDIFLTLLRPAPHFPFLFSLFLEKKPGIVYHSPPFSATVYEGKYEIAWCCTKIIEQTIMYPPKGLTSSSQFSPNASIISISHFLYLPSVNRSVYSANNIDLYSKFFLFDYIYVLIATAFSTISA